MRMVMRLMLLLLLLPASACQQAGQSGRPAVTIEAPESWRGIALPQHAGISEDMPTLFRQAVGSARPASGDRELLDPNLALPRAEPAPGAYRCRLVRLGGPAPSPPPARNRRPAREAFCFVQVADDRLSLTLETPTRPLGGFLWDSNRSDRLVFLGAEFGPRAQTAPPYGEPGAVSTAGLFERTGDFRYRLVVRGPAPGTVDVYELVAAPPPR
jgi:hypothetical protein